LPVRNDVPQESNRSFLSEQVRRDKFLENYFTISRSGLTNSGIDPTVYFRHLPISGSHLPISGRHLPIFRRSLPIYLDRRHFFRGHPTFFGRRPTIFLDRLPVVVNDLEILVDRLPIGGFHPTFYGYD
jgi:hypothetical protein